MFFNLKSLIIEQLSRTKQTLEKTKQLHALITKSHLSHDPFYATRLLRLYANNNDLHSARNLFDKTPQRTVYLWNSIIRGYAQSHYSAESFGLFKAMLKGDARIRPDCFTFACAVRMCCDEGLDMEVLRGVHGGVVVSGLEEDGVCCSGLVMGYCKMGCFEDAMSVFRKVEVPDLVLWNTMVLGCGCFGKWDKGLGLFRDMMSVGVWQPDGYTFVGLISNLVSPGLLGVGEAVHGLCLKNGLEIGAHVGSALVSMYSRFQCMDLAHRVFCDMVKPDLVTWSALVTGYSQTGDSARALFLFRKMNFEGRRADPVLVASMLVAVTQLAQVGIGSEIHGYVLRHGMGSDVKVSSALVDMYSKCGFLELGVRVFETMPNKNIVSYNSMILGFGLHGVAPWAFKTFQQVLKKGYVPDKSTFSALLCACCHAGLVQEGWDIFERMRKDSHVQAATEHYVHMVKLLGMAGQLEAAYKLVQSLTEPVDSGILGALLSCSHIQGNFELAETLGKRLLENEPEKVSYKVMLSSLCASNGRWETVEKLRGHNADGNFGKEPGLSWIGY